jgi:hypothetical protein
MVSKTVKQDFIEKLKPMFEGKTIKELMFSGFDVYPQFLGADVAYVVENDNISLIMILENGVFTIDCDSEIILI